MAHIKISKGLDIPMKGGVKDERVRTLPSPKRIALNVDAFERIKFKLLEKEGANVRIGQPLLLDKGCPEKVFVSPGSGKIVAVNRGLKRRLRHIVIELDGKKEYVDHGRLNLSSASREELIAHLLKGGLFPHIRMRPCNVLANPADTPRDIFVKAIESAPFAPSAEAQVEGFEKEFQTGLTALSKLTSGSVHLVHRLGSTASAFTEASDVVRHTAEGPHPVGNLSVHIHHIAPIEKNDEIVWTVTTQDVISIGAFLLTGHYHTDRLVSIAGEGILPEARGLYRARVGHSVESFIDTRNAAGFLRYISGNPLTGDKVEVDEYLGFYHNIFCALEENMDREFLHFFRLGFDKFTGSKAYVSGHLKPGSKEFGFSTNQHGEHRAFIDGSIYDKVMPMQIPTMHLVKAVMAGDFELAEELGLLEVDSEDFSLATFVCPCKIEMSEIIKDGLREFAGEILH